MARFGAHAVSLLDVVTGASSSIYSAGKVLKGRYRLDDSIATGGMAEVWRGHDEILQRPVAIKILHPHLASDDVVAERFRREAITAARLSHPHIVPTYDAGSDEDISFIVLGLIHGPSLAQVMKTRKISPPEAASIARQIADALDHAHRSGSIHRDIKPANILFVDDNSRVMVADFGIAKAVAEATDESLTLPGLVIGTPAYVAPEQMMGATADARSDIYALGVLLHEMVCGHTSVDLPTQAIATNGMTRAFTCRTLPGGLGEIVAKATAQSPDDRYATAAELRDALIEFEAKKVPPKPASNTQFSGTQFSGTQFSGEPTSVQAVTAIPTSAAPAAEGLSKRSAAPLDDTDSHHPITRGRRRRLVTGTVIVLAVLVAILLGRLIALSGVKTPESSTPDQPTTDVTVTTATSFDPEADGQEKETKAANAIDGNASTLWSTDTYGTAAFGGLKSGVGLIVSLSSNQAVKNVKVTSPTQGWAASIYASGDNNTPDNIAGWGAALDTKSNITSGETVFSADDVKATKILVWITNVGPSHSVDISEIGLKGP